MEEILQVLQDGVSFVINGSLWCAYLIADHLTLLIGLACAVIIAVVFDRWVAQLAATTPARQGRAAPRRVNRRPYLRTLITFSLWLVAVSLYPAPVPQLGAAMWVATVVVVLLLPTERAPVLGTCKNIILTYACALLGFLWYVNTSAAASPREWAAIIGGVGEAQNTLAQNQSVVLAIGTIGLTWSGPLAIALYVFKRLTAHLESLANPWQSAAEILQDIRTRPS
jgi:Ca2+/Na+ antiporter